MKSKNEKGMQKCVYVLRDDHAKMRMFQWVVFSPRRAISMASWIR